MRNVECGMRNEKFQTEEKERAVEELLTEGASLVLLIGPQTRGTRLTRALLQLSAGRVFPTLTNSEIGELLGEADALKAA